jgi:hypothetical protein
MARGVKSVRAGAERARRDAAKVAELSRGERATDRPRTRSSIPPGPFSSPPPASLNMIMAEGVSLGPPLTPSRAIDVSFRVQTLPPTPRATEFHPLKVTVTASFPSVVAVNTSGGLWEESSMVQVSPFCGLPTVRPSAPQPSAVVN